MFYKHILIEAYCSKEKQCNYLKHKEICLRCFEEKCEYLLYTIAPNEITITNDKGISIYDIGFGGDMETTETERESNIKRWEKICKAKISEAYDEYIKSIKNDNYSL